MIATGAGKSSGLGRGSDRSPPLVPRARQSCSNLRGAKQKRRWRVATGASVQRDGRGYRYAVLGAGAAGVAAGPGRKSS